MYFSSVEPETFLIEMRYPSYVRVSSSEKGNTRVIPNSLVILVTWLAAVWYDLHVLFATAWFRASARAKTN